MDDTNRAKQQADRGALRIFYRDHTGNPIPGVVVSIFADSSKNADSSREVDRRIATLESDQNGYIKFWFDRSIIGTSSRLRVKHGASRKDALILNIADLLEGNDTHTVRLDESELVPVAPHPSLPSILFPDAQDATLSPSSIGLIPKLAKDKGLCNQLMPTTMGVRRFQAFQINADICHPEELICQEPIQIVKGEMLEYEIIWHPGGTSLGDLLNTITLAPCEQVNVAIVDWMRRETALRTEATDLQQQSFQQMNHDRLIYETMQSSVKNKSKSWSIGGAFGKKIGLSGEISGIPVKLDITSAIGGAFGSSTSTQNIAASTTNQLSEHITQAASFVSSSRSSVVFQATASEQRTFQTRTIKNLNPCHALTMMYFGVNINYKVITDYKGKREVILVKYNNKDFDPERAYCNSILLKDALLDNSLLGCFDELAEALFCCDQKPPPKERLMDSLTITFKREGGTNPISMTLILNTANGPMTLPSINLLGQVQVGGTFTHTISLPGQIDPTKVTSLVAFIQYLAFGAPVSTMVVSGFKVTAHVVGDDNPLTLYSSQSVATLRNVFEMPVEVEPFPPDEGLNECIEKSCCVKKLLAHLNCHKRYYNALIWLNEDPDERVMKWSCCRKDDSAVNLINQIENTPVTVYGDFLVFPVAGDKLEDDPSILPVSNLITMPTPGVYAEGILGQCNTCEKVDPDRPWDWKDPPCGCGAPPVIDLPDPQTGVKPSDLRPDAISNLITFSNFPDAPDSIIKDLISTLISKADGGSNEAKSLLDKLLDTIKGSFSPETKPKEDK